MIPTVCINIPDDNFWFEVAKITSQVCADSTATAGDQYNLPRNVLKYNKKCYSKCDHVTKKNW